MLFHSGPLSGVWSATMRYFMSATSKSPCSCSIEPAANIAFTLVGSNAIELPRCSNASWYSPCCRQHNQTSYIQHWQLALQKSTSLLRVQGKIPVKILLSGISTRIKAVFLCNKKGFRKALTDPGIGRPMTKQLPPKSRGCILYKTFNFWPILCMKMGKEWSALSALYPFTLYQGLCALDPAGGSAS